MQLGLHITYTFTVKPVLSDHIKQDIFLAFQGGCFDNNCCMKVVQKALPYMYLHAAIFSNHLSIAISMSPEWMVV